ncbi:hypothetical protein Ddye_005366 [Dipteronia dyeriana]|uniref:HAT C-terminal dimerisation domain-containing protein n=1 Tax=Dipteronia dyeriana TaxID=168575 RepID=A0AAD9XGB6_9ROSI|nr:hypothetical protein Ddye_005366 [Dipteronia dyeriana]
MAEKSNATKVEPFETLTTDEVLVATKDGTKRKPTKTTLKVWIHFTKIEGAIGFSEDACRKALSKMIVLDELPFSFVEREGFHHFCSIACPNSDPLSRTTIARDINQLYLDEKAILKSMFSFNKQRVCLTTDCWISIQNTNYMVIKAHFIDSGVFTITTDNSSANDVAIKYVKRKLSNWVADGVILDGLKELLYSLYECYNGRNSNSIGTQSSNDFQLLNGMDIDRDKHNGDFRFAMLQKFKKMLETKDCIDTKNEVDRYLLELSEDPYNENFDILLWWKLNATKYKVLSQIVRDVFAIPVSTVACEFAFGT